MTLLKQLHLGSWWQFVTGRRLAPYVPTPPHVVHSMLQLASVSKGDCVHDVGAGDGRMLVTAALQCGARGVGYELDESLVAQARRNIDAAGVRDVAVVCRDALTADYSTADVVTLYLSDHGNAAVLPLLRQAAAARRQRGLPGARVVTFYFPLPPDERPVKTAKVNGIALYLYHLQARDNGPSATAQ